MMMTTALIINRFRYHMKGFSWAIVNMFVILTCTFVFISAFDYLVQKFSPYHWYFEYSGVVPVKDTFKVGSYPGFRSYVTYKRDVDMLWEDTLVCKQRKGHIVKYPTQSWPQRVIGGTSDSNRIWFYEKHKISDLDKACRLESTVTAITDFGFRKTWHNRTKWIKIRR